MKRLLLIVLCLLIFPWTPCQSAEPIQLARMNPWVAGSSGASCSTSTDYVGSTSTSGLTSDAGGNIIRCNLVQATASSGCASGTIEKAKLYHYGTSNDVAKMAIFNELDNTGTAHSPQAEDEIIGEWVTLSSSATEWAEASATGSVTIGHYYWVCYVTNATVWSRVYDGDTGIVYYRDETYDESMPTNLSGTWSSGTSEYRMHYTIGP